MKHISQV